MQISWYSVMSRLLSGERPLSDAPSDKEEHEVRNFSSWHWGEKIMGKQRWRGWYLSKLLFEYTSARLGLAL
jgi:hypothetical protein